MWWHWNILILGSIVPPNPQVGGLAKCELWNNLPSQQCAIFLGFPWVLMWWEWRQAGGDVWCIPSHPSAVWVTPGHVGGEKEVVITTTHPVHASRPLISFQSTFWLLEGWGILTVQHTHLKWGLGLKAELSPAPPPSIAKTAGVGILVWECGESAKDKKHEHKVSGSETPWSQKGLFSSCDPKNFAPRATAPVAPSHATPLPVSNRP